MQNIFPNAFMINILSFMLLQSTNQLLETLRGKKEKGKSRLSLRRIKFMEKRRVVM